MCGDPRGLAPGAAALHRATSPAASDGYAVEQRELWTEDGRRLALNQQIFAVSK